MKLEREIKRQKWLSECCIRLRILMILQKLILVFIGFNQGIESLGGMNKEFRGLRGQGFGSVRHANSEVTKICVVLE